MMNSAAGMTNKTCKSLGKEREETPLFLKGVSS